MMMIVLVSMDLVRGCLRWCAQQLMRGWTEFVPAGKMLMKEDRVDAMVLALTTDAELYCYWPHEVRNAVS
jgi:hypothetical protein